MTSNDTPHQDFQRAELMARNLDGLSYVQALTSGSIPLSPIAHLPLS